MRNQLFRALAASVGFFCLASYPGLQGWQANGDVRAKQQAQNQVGEILQERGRSATPGPDHTLADVKRAMQTFDAVFATYCRTPLLNPPRGFDVIHTVNSDARSTRRGWPIPVGTGIILVGYDSSRRLPSGRFASNGEGPVLGGLSMNSIDCGLPSAEKDFGRDEMSSFYYMPEQKGTVHGWPQLGGVVFMSMRTQPHWLPVSAERILNVQIAKARKTLEDVSAGTPQNSYAQWLSGRDKRLHDEQEAHDQMAKINKQQADAMLAQMIENDKKTEKMLASMAQQGSDLNKMSSQYQGSAAKMLQDLAAHLNSLSPQQRAAPAYVYESADGAFPVGQVVPPGTPGSVGIVYPNPDFYDKSLPAWEAQSLCVGVSTGPRSQEDSLYPTIVGIWKSLDWDALAQFLK
jgi:hypothetical protein